MTIDVTYQGLTLARDARVRFEAGAIFVETDGPMPVASRLTLSHGEDSLIGRVRRVREGQGAGMLIVPASADGAAEKLPRWLMPLHAESAKEEFFLPLPPPPAPPVAAAASEPTNGSDAATGTASSEASADAAESGRTPPPDGEGAGAASDDEEDGKAGGGRAADKKAGGTAKKAKKPRRR